jgi:hypothetical protein
MVEIKIGMKEKKMTTIEEYIPEGVVKNHRHVTDREMRRYHSSLNFLESGCDISVDDLGFFERRNFLRVIGKLRECDLCQEKYEEFKRQ